MLNKHYQHHHSLLVSLKPYLEVVQQTAHAGLWSARFWSYDLYLREDIKNHGSLMLLR
jgi:plasmid rolling circle replication initiator protein Rep